jgi:hypothetical protein
VEFSSD